MIASVYAGFQLHSKRVFSDRKGNNKRYFTTNFNPENPGSGIGKKGWYPGINFLSGQLADKLHPTLGNKQHQLITQSRLAFSLRPPSASENGTLQLTSLAAQKPATEFSVTKWCINGADDLPDGCQ